MTTVQELIDYWHTLPPQKLDYRKKKARAGMSSLDLSRLAEVFEAFHSDDAIRKMTPWEVDFTQDMERKFKSSGTKYFSERQLEVLEQIYVKV